MRGLVFVPQSRVYRESIEAIACQQFDGGLDFYFARSGDLPSAHRYDNITRKYQYGRQLALDGHYDFMVCMEDDVIPPPGAISRLADVESDVTYSLICARHEPYFWGVASKVEGEHTYEAVSARQWGKVTEVAGCGLYCTLIWRRVLEAVTFHRDTPNCCDWDFAVDCQRIGFKQVADMRILCGHILPDGRTVWPDRKSGYRIEAAA